MLPLTAWPDATIAVKVPVATVLHVATVVLIGPVSLCTQPPPPACRDIRGTFLHGRAVGVDITIVRLTLESTFN